jgi:hypothetical protein
MMKIFTHDLIRPFGEVFGFEKILNQVQNDVNLKSIFLFHCESCRTRFGISYYYKQKKLNTRSTLKIKNTL